MQADPAGSGADSGNVNGPSRADSSKKLVRLSGRVIGVGVEKVGVGQEEVIRRPPQEP